MRGNLIENVRVHNNSITMALMAHHWNKPVRNGVDRAVWSTTRRMERLARRLNLSVETLAEMVYPPNEQEALAAEALLEAEQIVDQYLPREPS